MMTCDDAEILLHALIDGELDAGHARAVEQHVATCARCAASLAAFRDLRGKLAAAELRPAAPASLRARRRAGCRRGAAAIEVVDWPMACSSPPGFFVVPV